MRAVPFSPPIFTSLSRLDLGQQISDQVFQPLKPHIQGLIPYILHVLFIDADTMSLRVAPSDKYELLRSPINCNCINSQTREYHRKELMEKISLTASHWSHQLTMKGRWAGSAKPKTLNRPLPEIHRWTWLTLRLYGTCDGLRDAKCHPWNAVIRHIRWKIRHHKRGVGFQQEIGQRNPHRQIASRFRPRSAETDHVSQSEIAVWKCLEKWNK